MKAPTAGAVRYGLGLMLLGAAVGAVGGAYVLPDRADEHPRIPGAVAFDAAGCSEFEHLTAYGECREVTDINADAVAVWIDTLARASRRGGSPS